MRDSLAQMPITDAIIMDNFIPRETSVELRKGYTQLFDSNGKIINSVMAFNTGTQKNLICAQQCGESATLIKIDPNDPANPDTLKENLFGSWFQHTQYKQKLFMVNGQDAPLTYDGETVGDNPFTYEPTGGESFDFQDLFLITQYKNRLFFGEKNTLRIFYTREAGNVAGPLDSFDLAQYAKNGGSTAAINNWTQTGATGQANQLVIVTTEGETFVFEGDDPGNAANWALRGVYLIPRVLGVRNTEKLAGNIIVLTKEGYFPLSAVLSSQYANNSVAFSDKVIGAVRALASQFESKGWQIKYVNSQELLIINAPLNNQESNQHVMNTRTGAWCRFTGINMNCLEILDDGIYFSGINGNLYKLFDGNNDNGTDIKGYVQQAYNNFGVGDIKAWKLIKFAISAALKVDLQLVFGVDYNEPKTVFVSPFEVDGALWDEATWDESSWSREDRSKLMQIAIMAYPGYYGSIGIKVNTQKNEIRWLSSLLTVEAGQQ